MTSPTASLFNRNNPGWDFETLVADRLRSGRWTAEELALSIKNQWLAGMDARLEDVLAAVKSVNVQELR